MDPDAGGRPVGSTKAGPKDGRLRIDRVLLQWLDLVRAVPQDRIERPLPTIDTAILAAAVFVMDSVLLESGWPAG